MVYAEAEGLDDQITDIVNTGNRRVGFRPQMVVSARKRTKTHKDTDNFFVTQ
jgi:hypothetical protein